MPVVKRKQCAIYMSAINKSSVISRRPRHTYYVINLRGRHERSRCALLPSDRSIAMPAANPALDSVGALFHLLGEEIHSTISSLPLTLFDVPVIAQICSTRRRTSERCHLQCNHAEVCHHSSLPVKWADFGVTCRLA